MKKIVLILITLMAFQTGFGQSIFVDDFNRSNNDTVGNSWNEYTTTDGGQVYNNKLRLGSSSSGRDYVSRDLSSLNNPITTDGITNNSSIMEWAFNFKGYRTGPSGFDDGNYGYGFVLGNTKQNYIGSGTGYAVIIGQSSSPDPIRLAKFTGGVNANSDFTNIISSGDYQDEYISVRVTYDPSSDEWSLYAESDSSAFPQSDPRNTNTLIGTEVDNTYTGTGYDLKYCGALYNHSGNNDYPLYFDDIYMPNLPNDSDSESANGTQPVAATISSLVDTTGEAIDVFKLDMADWGTSDGLPTNVTNIRFKPHTTNTADWTNNIHGFTVDNDGTAVTPASITVTNTYVDITFNSGDLVIADGTTPTFTFAVYLNTSNIEDGKILSFMVDADDHGFTADSSGSDFDSTFSGGDFNSNDFTIEVEATDISFIQQPSDVAGDVAISPSVTAAFTDVNGNVDEDKDGTSYTIGLTTTGSFKTGSTTEVDADEGIATFDNLIFDEAATDINLTTTDPDGTGFTTHTSDDFDVTGAPEILIEGNSTEIVSGDDTPDTADDTDYGDVDYNTDDSTKTFTIKNTGNVNLELTDASPYITMTGDTGDFTLTANPSTPIATNGNTTFSIKFDPTTYGTRTVTVSIANNDSDENPYTFDVQGNGTSTDEVDWAQLSTADGNIRSGDPYMVYTQIYEGGVTDADANAAGPGLDVWIGYSTIEPTAASDFETANWTWVSASYDSDSGNDDIFKLDLGAEINAAGKYYFVSRIQLNGGPYKYGGYKSGGGNFWDGVDYNESVLYIDIIDYCNLHDPATKTISAGDEFNVIGKIYEENLTGSDEAAAGTGIQAWIGYSDTDNDPEANDASWTWVDAGYLNDDGSTDDEYYQATFGSLLTEGTYYYASKFQLNSGPFKYGGTGGAWSNDSGVLTVEAALVDWGNIQSPVDGSQVIGLDVFNVYAQVKETDKTEAAGQADDIQVWIGWSAVDNDPTDANNAGDWHWIPATYNQDVGDNDEYVADLLDDTYGISIAGTYYYASRFQLFDGAYKYGGYDGSDGNFWNSTYNDGGSNKSGQFIAKDKQEIEVLGNGIIIVDGDSTPSTIDNTDFGYVAEPGSTVNALSFTITNLGDVDLHLTDASPDIVTIGGTNAGDFSVSVEPSTTIAGDTSTTFTITFDPSAEGLREATVSIANDDDDEDPFNFSIQGNGYTPCSQLIISEYSETVGGNYVQIYNPTGATVDLANYQVWRALNGGAWSGDGTTDVFSLSGNLDSGEVYILALTGQIPLADQHEDRMNYNGDDNIGLAWNGGSGSTFTLIDAVGDENGDPGIGWDVAGIDDATYEHTLIRKVTVDRPNTDWTTAAGTNVGDSEWIVVSPTQDYLTYHVSNCVTAPEIEVRGNNKIIYNGDTTPSVEDNTIFIDTYINGVTTDQTYTILNLGNDDLSISDISITGTDFTVSANASSPVTSGNNTTFTITFDPSVTGVITETVTITNDDTGESLFTFAITGVGIEYMPCDYTADFIFAIQDFDETTPSWAYTTDVNFFDNGSDGFFGVHDGDGDGDADDTGVAPSTLTDNINYINILNDYLIVADLDDEGDNGTGDFATITFADVDLSSAANVFFSFDYDVYQFDTDDDVKYQLFYDGVGQGEVLLVDGGSDLTVEGTEIISIPNSVNTLSFTISIKQNGGGDQAGFDNFKIVGNLISSTTWDGSSWSNGNPTSSKKAIINGNYATGTDGNIHTCDCLVKSGTVTVNDSSSMLVETDITNNGTILVQNEGSLVQHKDNATLSGTGIFQLTKESLVLNNYYEYVYWSSPINSATFSLGDIVSDAWRYFEYDPRVLAGTGSPWVEIDATDIPEEGLGYAISAPNNHTAGETLTVDFVKANDPFYNGNITVDIYKESGTYGDADLIGNPYPSAIDFNKFSNENTDIEASYSLWTNCAGLDANGHHQDSGYTTYSVSETSTAACSDATEGEADQYIASAQGFIVVATIDDGTSSTVTFKNNQRVTDNNDNFLNRPQQRNIVWVDMTDGTGKYNQIAVGFYTGATDAYDRNFDATSMNTGNGFALYSTLNTKKLAIQGLAELDGTDRTVPLGVESDIARTITMHINHTEGLTNEFIYVRDLYLNTIHDLKATDYTTTVTAGNFTDRFELIFTQQAMSMDDIMIDPNAVLLTQQSGAFTLISNNDMNITGVTVYDITGKMLYNNKDIDATSHQLDLQRIATGNMLIFRVQMNNESIVVKKAIKQ